MGPSQAPAASLLELRGQKHTDGGKDAGGPGSDVSRLLLVPTRVKDTTSTRDGLLEQSGEDDLPIHHPASERRVHHRHASKIHCLHL